MIKMYPWPGSKEFGPNRYCYRCLERGEVYMESEDGWPYMLCRRCAFDDVANGCYIKRLAKEQDRG